VARRGASGARHRARLDGTGLLQTEAKKPTTTKGVYMKRVTILTSIALAALAAGIAGQVSLAAPSAQTIRVTETSYRIKLSAKPKPGVVKFVVRNASDDPHDFVVRGGGKAFKSRVLAVSSGATVTARLKKGARYTFWCSVSDHAEEGMRGSFLVR
jgi:plastocyanin